MGYHSSKLLDFAIFGQIEELAKLINQGADVNVRDMHGRTPLMFAANNGHLEIVKILCENGAKVNAKDNRGQTARDIALYNNSLEIAEFLSPQNMQRRVIEDARPALERLMRREGPKNKVI